jgi:hypothetical protein
LNQRAPAIQRQPAPPTSFRAGGRRDPGGHVAGRARPDAAGDLPLPHPGIAATRRRPCARAPDEVRRGPEEGSPGSAARARAGPHIGSAMASHRIRQHAEPTTSTASGASL